MREYIVQYGDTLWSISKKELGQASRWHELSRLNFTFEPRRLFVGQRLKLPNYRGGIFGKGGIQKPRCCSKGHMQLPANLALARGFMFIIFEQLPEVGKGKIIRKINIAVVPKDFSMVPIVFVFFCRCFSSAPQRVFCLPEDITFGDDGVVEDGAGVFAI